jgi:toxin ParE1/3/4
VIARYTLERWGRDQAIKYTQSLRGCFETVAERPGIGRACDAISPGPHRHKHGSHVVFYRLKPGGIRVVRVLHQQMLPEKAHFEQ